MGFPSKDRRHSGGRTVAWALAAMIAGPGPVRAWDGSAGRDGLGLAGRAVATRSESALVDRYEALLRDGDLDGFRRNVAARYDEAALLGSLRATDPRARRAAVLALGEVGTYDRSNAAVVGTFRDADPLVRSLAHDAAWSLWYRAGTPEQNERLGRIREMIGGGRPAEAIEAAGRLIADAPAFAEAYNQKAIAEYLLGRYAASVEDCRLALERNPGHVGALSGMGQCLLRLGKRVEAVAAFRRAAELQPFDDGLRDLVARLEGAP